MSKKAGIDIVFENLIDISTGEKLVLNVSDNFDFEAIDIERIRQSAREFAKNHCVNPEDGFCTPTNTIN